MPVNKTAQEILANGDEDTMSDDRRDIAADQLA
jgi:hypothetical protein